MAVKSITYIREIPYGDLPDDTGFGPDAVALLGAMVAARVATFAPPPPPPPPPPRQTDGRSIGANAG